jgi:hypothetical protein
MFRKIISASVLGIVLAGSLVALTPANAATKISNGVLCPKANKTIKVSGTVYKCTKNPIVNKKKLTWVSSDCIYSNATYAKLSISYKSLVKAMPATLAALDAKISAYQAKIVENTAKAVVLKAQIATWQAKIVTFTAAKAVLLADPNPSKYTDQIRSYTAAIHSLNSAIAANTSYFAAMDQTQKTITTMQAQRAITVGSVTQVKAGVAQAVSYRNLICQKGL